MAIKDVLTPPSTPPVPPPPAPTIIDEDQQILSAEVYILLCSLRLLQFGIHHRHGPEVDSVMSEVTFRPNDDWKNAKRMSWGKSFWDEAASQLLTLRFFNEDPRNEEGLSGTDPGIALDDLIDTIENVRRNGPGAFTFRRFSGQQLLMILAVHFNVPVMAPQFPQNWNEWTNDELMELAFFLQMSDVCVELEGAITTKSVEAWLKDLECIFCPGWHSAVDGGDCGSSDWQSAIGDDQDVRVSEG